MGDEAFILVIVVPNSKLLIQKKTPVRLFCESAGAGWWLVL